MPMFYFLLYDGASLLDDEGTDLIDIAAARDHAAGVARELTFKSTGMMDHDWSNWTMRIHDNQGNACRWHPRCRLINQDKSAFSAGAVYKRTWHVRAACCERSG